MSRKVKITGQIPQELKARIEGIARGNLMSTSRLVWIALARVVEDHDEIVEARTITNNTST